MNRKYLFAILLIAIAITFCGTATAEEQNNIQDNSIVDTSNTTNTTNSTQDNQSDSNPEIIDDQVTNNETTQNTPLASTMASTSDPTPEIVITFDDGFESAYTVAFPIMQQYGIKGTVFINTAWVGSPGYLTLQQLTELHNAGWTIANHAWHHPALPTLNKEEITNEIQTAINWLKDNGFQDGAYHLAYPFGQYNDTVLEVCSELGIKTARTVNWGTISPDGYTLPYEQPLDYLQLPMILFSKDTTTNDWKLEVDSSIAKKTTAIFLLHNIVTSCNIYEDVNITTFTEFIAYIAQTGTKTLTINQWYNEMDNVAPVPSADLASGSYNTDLTVNLSVTDNMDSNPTIYYTLDGTTPTTSSTLYTGPISLNSEGTTTLKFIAVDYTGNISNVTERTYTIDKTIPTVTATPSGNTYYSPQNVILKANENASIYYTTDGTDPSKSSTLYTGPINISNSKTLKYTAWDTVGNQSPIYTQKYNIYKNVAYSYTVKAAYKVGYKTWYKQWYKKWYRSYKYKKWYKKWYKSNGKWKYKWRYYWKTKWKYKWRYYWKPKWNYKTLYKNEVRWSTKNVLT